MKLGNKNKKIKLPSKKTMNLYQPDKKNDPKRMILLGVLALVIIVAMLSKVFIIDGMQQINVYKEEIAALQNQVLVLNNRYAEYSELKEEYYRYSNTFSKDETQLVDRIEMINLLTKATEGCASINTVTIADNKVSISVYTKNLKDLSTLRTRLERNEMVKNVAVYSAQKSNGDVSSTVAFECVVLEEAE